MNITQTKENYFFMLGHLATDLCHGSLPIILAYMYQQGRLDSYASVALLMMANTILSAFVQPIAGGLADGKKPRPYLMSLGIFLAFFGVMFLGLIQNQVLLYALVCLNGIGSSLFHPIGGKMANVFGGTRLGKSMSIFSLGGNIGMALGPFYFTLFYMLLSLDATLMMCVPGILIIAVYLFKNRYYTIATLQNKKSIAKHGGEDSKEDIKGFVILLIVLFARSAAWATFVSFLALYFIHHLGVREEIATTLNGVVCLCGAIATYTGGTFSDRLGYNKLIIYATILSVPFIGLFTLTDNAFIACALLIPFSVCFFAAMSPTVVVGQKLLCKHVGMATGFTVGSSMSFGGIIAPIMGKLGDNYGIEYTMYAVAIFIILSALGSFCIPKVGKPKA